MRTGLILLLLALGAPADVVHVKGGKKLRGAVVSEDPEVVVNIYNSTVPAMVLGVERVPKSKVKKIVRTLPAPHHEFQRRLREAQAPDEFLQLAQWCASNKLKVQRVVALERALRLDPEYEDARKALGAKAPKGNWLDQYALAQEYVDAEDAAGRTAALAKIRRDPHFPFKDKYLQRAWRSARQAKGYQKDRPIAVRADKLVENARYTLFVPQAYDALQPTPLVIGLHGGGAGGADGKLVVGSGWQAMPFYQGECANRRWICACPTAVQAGWGGPNNEFIDALLEELRALYNIDEHRIYLVGHSMGGGGTWRQGSRIPEVWAAIAPAASYGVNGINKFDKTKTGFYVYHSDDDPRTRVGGVRPYMENLPGKGIDFVYTELPGRGHSFPGEVRADIFRFFAMRVLATGRGKFKPQVRAKSSFLRKVSRDEKKYLPPLAADSEAAGESLRALLKDLGTGGGVAEQAVPKLVAHADPKTSASVAKVMLKPKSGSDVRRYAARVLGGRKAAGQLKALGRILLVETESNALLDILAAIGEINDAAGGDAVVRFLKKRGNYFDKRLQGTLMSQSDWETILPTMARACTLLGTFKSEKGAGAIASSVLDKVFLSGMRVRYDRQNQRPLPAARALAEAACEALGRLGGQTAIDVLQKMAKAGAGAGNVDIKVIYGPVATMGEWARDARINGWVEDALETLRG